MGVIINNVDILTKVICTNNKSQRRKENRKYKMDPSSERETERLKPLQSIVNGEIAFVSIIVIIGLKHQYY